MTDDLAERVGKFQRLELPGQPMGMHMGTAYLVDDLWREVQRLREAKDGAYFERNQLVAALAAVFPSGIARTDIPGWEPEWHGCVYIDLPTGQASWHYHDSHAHLFAHLKPYQGQWDGHSTEEKYKRLARLCG